MTVHRIPVDIPDDRMGAFFTKFGEVNEVKALSSKAGIETGDMEIQITLNRKDFQEIPNILVCRDWRMLVVVEGRKPWCWSCGVSGHMVKESSSKKNTRAPARPESTVAKTATIAAGPAEEGTSKSDGEWKEVSRGRKLSSVSSPPDKEMSQEKKKLPEKPKEVRQPRKEGQPSKEWQSPINGQQPKERQQTKEGQPSKEGEQKRPHQKQQQQQQRQQQQQQQ